MNLTANQIIEKRKEQWELHKNIKKDEAFVNAVVDYIKESEDLQNDISNHPEYLIEMCFVVVDKEQNIVPFFMNTVQKMFINDLNQALEDYKAKKRLHLKFLILKGRQQGFTQIITAYQLACAISKKNFSGITISDCTDNTETIFQKKAKFQFNHIPEALKPSTKYNNRREFLFDKLNSSWFIDTAENGDVGRSNTLNFFHGSEAALWKSISKIITGLGEALTKNSIQILESTAMGYNEYKDLWDNAGDNTWEAKFYEWWLTPEYTTDFESEAIKIEFINNVKSGIGKSGSEKQLFIKLKYLSECHNLNYNQLYWYYNKWKGYIDKEKIKQEYPCSPAEAFLSSGRCVFDKETVIKRIDYLTQQYKIKTPKRGYFYFEWNNSNTKDFIKQESIRFVEDSQGYIKIYEDIQPNYPYVIGGDTSSGVAVSDFFAGTVINNVTGKRAATLHARLDPDTYAHQMYCLGMYYNQALVSIEVNFDLYPIKELERLHYPRQYYRQQLDSYTNQYIKKNGWKTDGNTRPLIISKEISLIRDNSELFTDITMLNECLTFVYDKNNRPDAENGKHDDLLMSDMIANEARNQQTFEAMNNNSSNSNPQFSWENKNDDWIFSKVDDSFINY